MHPLAGADQQHRGDGRADGNPGRLRQGDRPERVGEKVRRRNDQCPAGTDLRLLDPEKGIDPCPQSEEPGDEGQGAMRLKQVKQRPGERHQRKGADAARNLGLVAFVDLLEGEAEEQGQGDDQGEPLGKLDRWHGRVYHAASVIQSVDRSPATRKRYRCQMT